MNETALIIQFFKKLQIKLCEDWLEQCINWCKEEILRPQYTFQELQMKIYEQWLILDLREVQTPCLPPNLSSQIKFVLTGNYSLQVLQIVDISKPKLWQLNRIRNAAPLTRNVENEKEENNGKRVLQLTLTDGVQEIIATEYKPIPNINVNLPPGIKIRIFGPITIRRGRLLLERHNIKILGGEVAEIKVLNHAENVLARALNLPLNENPARIDENSVSIADKTTQPLTINIIETQNQRNQINSSNRKNNSFNNNATNNTDKSTNEDREIDEEIEAMLEVERELEMEAQRSRQNSTTPDLFDDDLGEEILNNIEAVEDHHLNKTINKPSTTNLQNKKNNPVLENSDDDFFADMDIDSHLNEIDNKCPSPENQTLTIENFTKSSVNEGKFKLKVKFRNIAKKLSFKEEVYEMEIVIYDESGELEVRVDSKVLSELIGLTPSEMTKLKSGVLGQEETAKRTILKALSDMKDKLIQLDNIVEIEAKQNEKPIVINIF